MSQSIMVPVTGQGMIVDRYLASYLPDLAGSERFGCTDVYLYSHGWWTTANTAMVDYARFSIGMVEQSLNRQVPPTGVAPRSGLEVGVHWPAMISEDDGAAVNRLEPLTFFNRAAMADTVGERAGYALLRLIVEHTPADRALRFHLIGHSFGCRVVCAALTELFDQTDRAVLERHQFDLVLLQAATDADSFAPGGTYASLLDPVTGVRGLRLLLTRSDQDRALGEWYPLAYEVAHLFGHQPTALGAAGPDPTTPGFAHRSEITVGPNADSTGSAPPAALVVADLGPIHRDGSVTVDEFQGHHSDIYRRPIYQLLADFFEAES